MYKLKHIPTGLYYQPHKHRGSNLSKTGKVYCGKTHGLSGEFRNLKNNPYGDYIYYAYADKTTKIVKETGREIRL